MLIDIFMIITHMYIISKHLQYISRWIWSSYT